MARRRVSEAPRGQHLDREARAAITNMTPAQRKEYVRKLVLRGFTERQIARAIGMSNSGTHYLVSEIKGRPRSQERMTICQGCWDDHKVSELDGGLCVDCRDGTE
jgi:FixJ family two-component response regulator